MAANQVAIRTIARRLTAVLIAASLFTASTAFSSAEPVKWMTFTAPSIQFNGKNVELAAILISVRIEPLGVSGWLQFDTGVNTSSLYEGTLRRIGHALAHRRRRYTSSRRDSMPMSRRVSMPISTKATSSAGRCWGRWVSTPSAAVC
jgi:hypothetical protein